MLIGNGPWTEPDPTVIEGQDPIGVLPGAQGLYEMGGPEPFPFGLNSYFNPLQEAGFDTLLGGAQQAAADSYGLRGLLGGLYGSAITSLTDTLDNQGAIPPQNPYGSAAIEAAVGRHTDDVLRNIMPRTDLAAVGAGQTGSSRHGVLQANAMNQSQDAVARAAGEQGSRDYNAWLGAWGRGQDQLSKAWQLTPHLFNNFEAGYMRPSAATQHLGGVMTGIGDRYQGLTDAMLGDQQRIWDAYENRPYDNMDWYANLVYGNPGAAQGTQTTTGSESPWLQNVLGGASLGYGLWDQFNNSGSNWGSNPSDWMGVFPGF